MTTLEMEDLAKAPKQDGGGLVQVFATVMHMEGEHEPRVNLG